MPKVPECTGVLRLPADFNIRDFDVSSDGREILLERVEDHPDIVLIDLPPGDS